MNSDKKNVRQKVAVLMSTYNGEKYLRDQINSILSQKGVDVLLIVRDDGSSDHTIDILNEYKESTPNFELIYGKNCGSTHSFSTLLEYVYSKYEDNVLYSFADQDDVWLEEKLYVASQKVDSKSNRPVLYCSNLTCVNKELKYLHNMRKDIIGPYPKFSTLVEPIATGCTMVFNSEAARLYLLKYDKSVRMHDIFMSFVVAYFGEIYYDNKSYILYRQHGKNQIGSGIGLKNKVRGKLKSILSISNQHLREIDTRIFLEKYKTLLNKEDQEVLNIVAYYRYSFMLRMNFLFGKNGIKIRRLFSPNIWLYLRILIGKV